MKQLMLIMMFSLFAFAGDVEKEMQFMREYGLAMCLFKFHQIEPSNVI